MFQPLTLITIINIFSSKPSEVWNNNEKKNIL